MKSPDPVETILELHGEILRLTQQKKEEKEELDRQISQLSDKYDQQVRPLEIQLYRLQEKYRPFCQCLKEHQVSWQFARECSLCGRITEGT